MVAKINADSCTGCGSCIDECPAAAIFLNDDDIACVTHEDEWGLDQEGQRHCEEQVDCPRKEVKNDSLGIFISCIHCQFLAGYVFPIDEILQL